MIKKASSKFNDSSIPPRIRQILLHWGNKLTESDSCNYFFISIKHELLLV